MSTTNRAVTWIAYESHSKPSNSPSTRREVRAAASRSSAITRKATIARKRTDAIAFQQQEENAKTSAAVTGSATPLLLKNACLAGIAFETKLWAKIVLNGDLHSVALLVVSTKMNLTGTEGRCGPSTPGVIFLRGSALRRMQMALASPSLNSLEYAASSLPICLSSLAGWEQVYGDSQSHEIHLRALRSIFGTTDRYDCDSEEHRAVDMLSSIAQAVHKRYDELSNHIASDGSLYIAPGFDTTCTNHIARTLPKTVDCEVFDLSCRQTRTLLFLLRRLATYDLFAANAWPAMHELSLLVFAWKPMEIPPSTWTLLVKPKEVEHLALYHIRAGMIAVLGAWTYAVARLKPNHEDYFSSADAMDEHYMEVQSIETEYLLGTEFEEATLWSIFIVTATATPSIRTQRSLDLIGQLLGSTRIHVRNFEQLESLLRKYAYQEAVYRKACLALYHSVTTGVPAGEDDALRRLTLKIADFFI